MNKILIVLLLMVTSTAFAGIYKWVDKQGNIHFGDRPPESAKTEELELRINTFEGVSVEGLRESVGKKVVIYTTPTCGFCKKAKVYFKKNNIAYTDFDISKDKRAHREFIKLGGKGVPLILVGKSKMSGFNEARFEKIYSKK